jgi:SAM-dependent methyltransferase
MIRKLYYRLTPSQRLLARRIAFFPVDVIETIIGLRDRNIPPRGMIFTGTGDFRKAGQRYLELFINHGGLKSDHRVLDVGSGIGRMALALTTFLSEKGHYEGFDIVPLGVKWCQKNISNRFPLFNFKLIQLKNDLYSLKGQEAESFTFPYPDQEFDFVFLTSVFTHMLPLEVENYMKEISRVLKPGGTCFSTFFIYSNSQQQFTAKPFFTFPIDHGYYRLMDHKVQSANVAFSQAYIEQTLAADNNLKIKTILPGFWHDITTKDSRADFQDIVVFLKS